MLEFQKKDDTKGISLTSNVEAASWFHRFPKLNVGWRLAIHTQSDLQIPTGKTHCVPQSVVDSAT